MQGTHASGPSAGAQTAPKRLLEERLRTLQLGLSADAIRDTALSSPGWAMIMAGLFGGFVPELGSTPFSRSWPWVVLCALVGIAVLVLWRVVKVRATQAKL